LLLAARNQHHNHPRWLQLFNGPLKIAGLTLPSAYIPCSACFIRSRSGTPKSLIENR
jgi:hypothetical protein